MPTASSHVSPLLTLFPSAVRNVYTYINFGDFVDGSTNTTADPYVRMLSTTNDSAAVHAAFVSVRGDSPWTPSGATLAEKLRARRTLIIAVAAASVLHKVLTTQLVLFPCLRVPVALDLFPLLAYSSRNLSKLIIPERSHTDGEP